ncbi:hypothetical protein LCGC14_1747730 [marine sediment metagenome]|uniref:HNH nuclease domain-containing protein n=1 Tax=marine sediment metagenome TaxID=412755 RepID=A0A0F9H4R6_9ZZZZ
MKICEMRKCVKKYYGRGLCEKHYTRQRRHGDPLIVLYRDDGSNTICEVDKCNKKAIGRGWCHNHYKNWQRNGCPITPAKRASLEERFSIKVDIRGEDECWLWYGAITSVERGSIRVEKKCRGAHVIAWELGNNRLIPTDKEIHHKCQNPLCMNFNHLQLVTNEEHKAIHYLIGKIIKWR